jgi:hypothetical protein
MTVHPLSREIALLCFLAAFVTGTRCAVQTFQDENIRAVTVRLLDGRTGRPVKHDPMNIWFGNEKHPIYPNTDTKGEVVVKVNAAKFREIRAMASVHADCCFKRDDSSGMQVKYSVGRNRIERCCK